MSTPRVVVDTNVVVRGLINAHSASGRLLDLQRARVTIVVEPITSLNEFEEPIQG